MIDIDRNIDDDLIIKNNSHHIHSNEKSTSHLSYLCWIAFWVNIGLALFKITIGTLTNTIGAMGYSQLLIIDGLNSAANAIIITMLIFGINMSKPGSISPQYPYGRGKAQYIAILLVGTLLSTGAAFILILSFRIFFIPANLEPVGIGLCTSLISICANIIFIVYLKQESENSTIKTIIKLQYISIISSAILSNSLILAGLFDWFFMERIGSFSISLLVVGLSVRIIKQSLDGIMDKSSGVHMEYSIGNIARSVNQVQIVKWVRTRFAGHNLCVDLRVGINGENSVRQTDKISHEIIKRLNDHLYKINHVITLYCYPV